MTTRISASISVEMTVEVTVGTWGSEARFVSMTGIQAMVRQMEARRTAPADRHAQILALSKSMSSRKVARQIGVSHTTVNNVLRKKTGAARKTLEGTNHE